MLLRGGENVCCSKVEAALYPYPGIGECAVFSVPDQRPGEEVGAAIFPKPRTTINTNELRRFVKSKPAAFKVPRHN